MGRFQPALAFLIVTIAVSLVLFLFLQVKLDAIARSIEYLLS